MALTAEAIRQALSEVKVSDQGKDLVSLGALQNIAIDGGRVGVTIALAPTSDADKARIGVEVERALKRLPGVKEVAIDWSARPREAARPANALPGVKNVIAVGAGKGGVGKSTISVLTAAGLAREGAKVGLMDADIYGPSIPKMLGIEHDRPTVNGNNLVPLSAHGIRVMSMGFLVEPEKAVVWRGPMVHGVIQQFLRQVEWGELDYLIVDLPPGTGDVPLSLAQSIPMTGAVIVCTPQDVALLDAVKALKMYQQLNVDILGIVENMIYFRAPDTGTEYDLFGRGGAKRAADRIGVPFLGEVPINISIRVAGDEGTPLSVFDKTDEATKRAIMAFVRNISGQVHMRNVSDERPLELKIT